ncbi:hypothetical protein M405DRAFT_816059 [Rhizopogon salebrosus TDB-379]|nr:hypothetical protein M405DRAFT_816059 [Rhizopogon salebrosus TDB-379]
MMEMTRVEVTLSVLSIVLDRLAEYAGISRSGRTRLILSMTKLVSYQMYKTASSSAMAGFPEEGTYRIKLVGSDKYAGVSMPGGTGILRIPSEGWAPYNKWVLKYREDRGVGSERLCTLTGMSRSHYLGVLDVENKKRLSTACKIRKSGLSRGLTRVSLSARL